MKNLFYFLLLAFAASQVDAMFVRAAVSGARVTKVSVVKRAFRARTLTPGVNPIVHGGYMAEGFDVPVCVLDHYLCKPKQYSLSDEDIEIGKYLLQETEFVDDFDTLFKNWCENLMEQGSNPSDAAKRLDLAQEQLLVEYLCRTNKPKSLQTIINAHAAGRFDSGIDEETTDRETSYAYRAYDVAILEGNVECAKIMENYLNCIH